MHGAWCWDRLIPELTGMGHGAVAVDMPVDRLGLSVDDYADSVVEGLDPRDGEDIYLVGHSMGGFIIPRVAAKLPSARLIFLCAVLSHTSEQELRENMAATSPAFMGWAGTDSDGRMIMTSENARAAFYHDTPSDLADWAIAKLRPQWPIFTTVGPLPEYADRVAGVVYTLEDRIILPEEHRRLALSRFGREPIALAGDHSPFLSRPAELAAALDRIVREDRAAN